GSRPSVFSLTSVEAMRSADRSGNLFTAIQQAEQRVALAAGCIVVPAWVRDQMVRELGVDEKRVHAFPMEARLPSGWQAPLDCREVRRGLGLGPCARLLLFIGPLEHAAGPDLLVEALPAVRSRIPSLRIAFAGAGDMHGALQDRANQLGLGGMVRVLGHVDRPHLVRLMRAAEALVLPSRDRKSTRLNSSH